MDRNQLGNRQFIVGRRHHQEISSFRQGKDEPGGSIQLSFPPSIHNFPDGVCQLRVGQAGFGLSRIEDLHRYSLAASRSGENSGAEAHSLGPQRGLTFATTRPTSSLTQASRLARLAVVGYQAIARAALVPEDVRLVSQDRVTDEGVVGGRRPSEALAHDHPTREGRWPGWNVMDYVVPLHLHTSSPE